MNNPRDKAMKILAIDDNPDNLTTLKAIAGEVLTACVVLTALGGVRGIELARAEDPDVILLDIVMPGMDGFEVCRRLKADEQTNAIPVVFLTALQASRESRVKALEVGAEAFLAKPIDEQELVAQIRAMTRLKSAHKLELQEKDRLAALVAERTAELQQQLAERVKVEANLKASNTLLNALINSPGDIVIFSLDRNYCYTTFNEKHRQEMRQVWQADIEVGTSLLEAMSDPRLRQLARQSIDRALGGESFTEIQHQPGVNIHYEFVWNPVRQVDGGVAGVTAFVRDVSQRVVLQAEATESRRALLSLLEDQAQAQAALQDSEALTRAVIDNLP